MDGSFQVDPAGNGTERPLTDDSLGGPPRNLPATSWDADELLQKEPPPLNDDYPADESQSTGERHDNWQYPPEFWDRLSTVPLTRHALREFDRRTRALVQLPSGATAKDIAVRRLSRFARQGGPDLCDLRDHPYPTKHKGTGAVRSDDPSTTPQTPASTTPDAGMAGRKKKQASIYDRAFGQHLADHNIYLTYDSREPSLGEVTAAITVPRPSLSLSNFSDGAFRAFRDSSARARDEDEVLCRVVPTICGAGQDESLKARNTLFRNLEPLTDGTLAAAMPDIYYGSRPGQLDRDVRDILGRRIAPSTTGERPIVPNFSLEVKGPLGSPGVARLQACYNGAIGARAMHSLRSWGRGAPAYDEAPCAFSSTYTDGTLRLFAHHMTAPAAPGGEPGYHMTEIEAFAMTGNRESFVKGAAAFRNIRDLAKRLRDSSIRDANTRASLLGTGAVEGLAREIEGESGDRPAYKVVGGGAAPPESTGRRRRRRRYEQWCASAPRCRHGGQTLWG
ncbi:uncharacterized protein DNG_00939 [Cephalotrichum gorgonifer]|uniref:DUF7924 domain-containing protein n=1 Tax=Cephalotrichum gorgonifer TaxID=2041049 RepID=A0AAE8MRQ6_9PEZI|nr:uncharacterized protein DNG_00939 [Cephalotrichum gorgonifer]